MAISRVVSPFCSTSRQPNPYVEHDVPRIFHWLPGRTVRIELITRIGGQGEIKLMVPRGAKLLASSSSTGCSDDVIIAMGGQPASSTRIRGGAIDSITSPVSHGTEAHQTKEFARRDRDRFSNPACWSRPCSTRYRTGSHC